MKQRTSEEFRIETRTKYFEKSGQLYLEVEEMKKLFYFNMAQTSQKPWEPTGDTTGTDIKQYNINCTTGQEILVDYDQRFTTMGQMFFDRWRSHNKKHHSEVYRQ